MADGGEVSGGVKIVGVIIDIKLEIRFLKPKLELTTFGRLNEYLGNPPDVTSYDYFWCMTREKEAV